MPEAIDTELSLLYYALKPKNRALVRAVRVCCVWVEARMWHVSKRRAGELIGIVIVTEMVFAGVMVLIVAGGCAGDHIH